MEVKAIGKYVKVQPRKVRIIADEVRGRSASYSAALLKYHPSKSARALRKVLVSAMANAEENHRIPAENLRIATIMVDEGPVQKRMRARAMGRGFRILKKTSHITVVVEEVEAEGKVKPHGTKAKPRPKFGAPKGAPKKKGAEAPVEEVIQPEAVTETTDTAVEEVTAAPEEATPVAESEAPEENAGAPDLEHESTAEAEGAETEKGAE